MCVCVMPPKGSKKRATKAREEGEDGERGDSQPQTEIAVGALPVPEGPMSGDGPLVTADQVNEPMRRPLDKRGRAQRPAAKPEWDVKRPVEVVANIKTARGVNGRTVASEGQKPRPEKGVTPRCNGDGVRMAVDPVTLEDMRQRIAERGPRLREHLESQVEEADTEEDEELGVPDRLAMVRRAIRELDRAMQGLEETRPDVMRTWERFGEYFRSANPRQTPVGPLRTVTVVDKDGNSTETAVHAYSMEPPLPDMDGPWLGANRRAHRREPEVKRVAVEADPEIVSEAGATLDVTSAAGSVERPRKRVAEPSPLALPEQQQEDETLPEQKVKKWCVENYSDDVVRRYLTPSDPRSAVDEPEDEHGKELLKRTAEATLESIKAMRSQLTSMKTRPADSRIGLGCHLEPNMMMMVKHKEQRLRSLLDEIEHSVEIWTGATEEKGKKLGRMPSRVCMWRDPVYMHTVEVGIEEIMETLRRARVRHDEAELSREAALMKPPVVPPPTSIEAANGEKELRKARGRALAPVKKGAKKSIWGGGLDYESDGHLFGGETDREDDDEGLGWGAMI